MCSSLMYSPFTLQRLLFDPEFVESEAGVGAPRRQPRVKEHPSTPRPRLSSQTEPDFTPDNDSQTGPVESGSDADPRGYTSVLFLNPTVRGPL